MCLNVFVHVVEMNNSLSECPAVWAMCFNHGHAADQRSRPGLCTDKKKREPPLCPQGQGSFCSEAEWQPYVRLVVVRPTLTDLRGEVVRCPNARPGQLHGAAQPQFTNTTHSVRLQGVKEVQPQRNMKYVFLCMILRILFCVFCGNWFLVLQKFLRDRKNVFIGWVKGQVHKFSSLS